MPAASPDLRKELNGAEEDGPEHDARIFGEVTDLFLSNVDRLRESQISAFDEVLVPLIDRTEAGMLAHLSEALSTTALAPGKTIRKLAFHDDAVAAAPVLRRSARLSDGDLIEIGRASCRERV